jgi:hypothetical protein
MPHQVTRFRYVEQWMDGSCVPHQVLWRVIATADDAVPPQVDEGGMEFGVVNRGTHCEPPF